MQTTHCNRSSKLILSFSNEIKNILAESEVRTPKDGNKWMIAKAFLQVADFAVVEIYEHLLKTHIRIEPICICIHRHLPPKHPLYMFLKIHCRGLLPINSYGFPRLTGEQKYTHKLFGMGHVGTMQILNNGYLNMKWKDNDLLVNIKVCINFFVRLPSVLLSHKSSGKH